MAGFAISRVSQAFDPSESLMHPERSSFCKLCAVFLTAACPLLVKSSCSCMSSVTCTHRIDGLAVCARHCYLLFELTAATVCLQLTLSVSPADCNPFTVT